MVTKVPSTPWNQLGQWAITDNPRHYFDDGASMASMFEKYTVLECRLQQAVFVPYAYRKKDWDAVDKCLQACTAHDMDFIRAQGLRAGAPTREVIRAIGRGRGDLLDALYSVTGRECYRRYRKPIKAQEPEPDREPDAALDFFGKEGFEDIPEDVKNYVRYPGKPLSDQNYFVLGVITTSLKGLDKAVGKYKAGARNISSEVMTLAAATKKYNNVLMRAPSGYTGRVYLACYPSLFPTFIGDAARRHEVSCDERGSEEHDTEHEAKPRTAAAAPPLDGLPAWYVKVLPDSRDVERANAADTARLGFTHSGSVVTSSQGGSESGEEETTHTSVTSREMPVGEYDEDEMDGSGGHEVESLQSGSTASTITSPASCSKQLLDSFNRIEIVTNDKLMKVFHDIVLAILRPLEGVTPYATPYAEFRDTLLTRVSTKRAGFLRQRATRRDAINRLSGRDTIFSFHLEISELTLENAQDMYEICCLPRAIVNGVLMQDDGLSYRVRGITNRLSMKKTLPTRDLCSEKLLDEFGAGLGIYGYSREVEPAVASGDEAGGAGAENDDITSTRSAPQLHTYKVYGMSSSRTVVSAPGRVHSDVAPPPASVGPGVVSDEAASGGETGDEGDATKPVFLTELEVDDVASRDDELSRASPIGEDAEMPDATGVELPENKTREPTFASVELTLHAIAKFAILCPRLQHWIREHLDVFVEGAESDDKYLAGLYRAVLLSLVAY